MTQGAPGLPGRQLQASTGPPASGRARVAAVVVAWRELGATLEAIESLLASSIPFEPVICVAQQYTRDDLASLQLALAGHVVFDVAENLGFAAAVNLAMGEALALGADWVLLANNDATVDPACVERCLAEADRHERVAAIGPAVVYAHDPSRLWFAGATHSRRFALVWHRGHFSGVDHLPRSADSDYIPGCCVLIRAAAWRDVGRLREDFFMYYEDAEWGERARARGWRLRYLGEVLCHHAMALSSGQDGSRALAESTAYYLGRNPLRYARETPDAVLRLSRTVGVLTVWTAYNLTRIRPSQWPSVGLACLQGMRDGWTGTMGPRPEGRSARPGSTRAARARRPRGGEASSTGGCAPQGDGAPPGERTPLAGARCVIVYDCLFPWTIGGAERWYRVLAERLASAGAHVTYLTRVQWDGPPPSIPGVEVVAVQGPVDLYLADGTRRMGPPLRFGAGVLSWLLRHRRDVDSVHVANFPYFSLIGARIALAGTHVAVFADWFEVWPATFWRSYAGTAAGTVGVAIQRLCIALSPRSLVFWEHTARRMRERHHRGELTVLPGLLPGARVDGPVELDPPGTPVVLFAGRHVKDKGVRMLPETLRRARRSLPDLQMVIAGEGPETGHVASEMRRLGLEPAVRMPGKVSDEELARLIAHASCVVVASVREGYGLMVVEAAALGTPAVVAAHPENAAVGHVIEGINGFVVEPNPEGLSRGVGLCIAGGAALRSSTANWYASRAASMSMESSASRVVALYTRHGIGRRRDGQRGANLQNVTGSKPAPM
ncbi:MAG: glycosyltransferase [Acidimicrobiales bacterium]